MSKHKIYELKLPGHLQSWAAGESRPIAIHVGLTAEQVAAISAIEYGLLNPADIVVAGILALQGEAADRAAERRKESQIWDGAAKLRVESVTS